MKVLSFGSALVYPCNLGKDPIRVRIPNLHLHFGNKYSIQAIGVCLRRFISISK
jgi:hypothetical protein